MGDVDGIVTSLLEFDVSKASIDRSSFQAAVEKHVRRWVRPRPLIGAPKSPEGGPVSIGDLMGGIMFVMQDFKVCLRGDVASTLCAIGISEGLIRQLDPQFDMTSGAVKYLKYLS